MRKFLLMAILLASAHISREFSPDAFLIPIHYKTVAVDQSKVRLEKDISCLADNIYFEARSEDLDGRLAVAQVTLNRTRYKFFPKTICGVVYDHAQFSWTLHKHQHKDKKVYRQIVLLSRTILTKHLRSGIIGNRVIFYHATYIVPPAWTKNNNLVATIGTHVFYERGEKL